MSLIVSDYTTLSLRKPLSWIELPKWVMILAYMDTKTPAEIQELSETTSVTTAGRIFEQKEPKTYGQIWLQ